ncbi:hypothetical protein NIE88_11070 [Sporolactobacillus shoreicorticis]|uniref:DUF4190 domain-containing protein n=1 Tax=Sporolactobacillus shoreicorticis TaxID=1923877 RepID=A0ABW5S418_9BACL|nr:hypothetical protein [Sporolactobacillus shoreicorticis]MCO7126311.1 hypothetical protein [Sporolactobacillus shoreicorticis]
MADKDHFHDEDSLYDKQSAYRNEEYAKELAADQYDPEAERGRADGEGHRRIVEGGKGVGWLALICSVIALFFLPIVLGIAGIIIGYIALREGARTLGGWAIGIGCLAVLIQLLSPLFW